LDKAWRKAIQACRKINEASANAILATDDNDIRSMPSPYPMKVRIFDEVISAAGMFEGEIQKKQEIIKSSWGKYPIGPVRKLYSFVGEDKDAVTIWR